MFKRGEMGRSFIKLFLVLRGKVGFQEASRRQSEAETAWENWEIKGWL
jgi:hypothetical protein